MSVAVVEAPQTTPDAPSGRGRRGVVIAAVVVIVVLAVAAGFLGWRLYDAKRLASARSDAMKAGQAAMADTLSYDYRSLDGDLSRARSQLTPEFGKEFDSVAAQSVRPNAVKDKVVTSATVPAASVVSATPGTVHLLLYVNQLTSSAKKDNVVSQSRVDVTMKKVGGHWLISDLRAI